EWEKWPLLWPLPLRRQGEAGRGCPRFAATPTAPLPNPPLPSQGRGLKDVGRVLTRQRRPGVFCEGRRVKTRPTCVEVSAERPPYSCDSIGSQPIAVAVARCRKVVCGSLCSTSGGSLLRSIQHSSPASSRDTS